MTVLFQDQVSQNATILNITSTHLSALTLCLHSLSPYQHHSKATKTIVVLENIIWLKNSFARKIPLVLQEDQTKFS